MSRGSKTNIVNRSTPYRCVFGVMLFALSFYSSAFPASQGLVRVTVTDAASHVVAGATVELRLNGQVVASAETDTSGSTSLRLSAAGKYDFTISKSGYVTTQATLEVPEGEFERQVDVVLPQSELRQQQVEVTATSSNPAAESSSLPTNITPAQAKATATKPATVVDALPLIPGVVRATDGSVQIAGYGETHSALLVNSVNVTDPGTGEFGLSVPIDSVETISVSEMPYLVEYGKFTAGVVAAETRRGGEKWEWNLNDPLPDFRIRSSHLQGIRDASPRVNVSGPVIAGKLYFVEGAEYLLYKRQVYTLPFPANQTTSEAINSFSQLDWITSAKHTITGTFHIAPQSLQYAGLNYFNPQPVTPNASFRTSTATVIDRLSIGGGLLQSTFAGTIVTSGVNPQEVGAMILTPGGNTGSYFSNESRRASRFQWLESWEPKTIHFHGEHLLKIGSLVSHSENEGQFHPQPVLVNDNQGRLLQRIDFTGIGHFDLSDTEPAIYLQDHWMVNPHFALDLGVRVEGQTITHTVRSGPRMGFVWNPKGSPNTVIRGGVGVFYDSVPLDVYAFRTYPEQVVTIYSPDGVIVDGPRTYVNVIGSTNSKFDFVKRSQTSGNFAPYNLAGNIEVERSFDRFLTLRFKYLQSTASDRIGFQQQKVGTGGVLLLGSTGAAHTRQFEFTARIGDKSRQFFFSYVRQHARGDVNDANAYLGNFPFPVVRSNVFGSLSGEIPNRFLLWGTYSLPHKWMISPKLELRNGFPYRYTDEYQNYVATEGAQPRFPRYFSADLRVSKDIAVGSKHAVRLSGNVLNLTNHFNALEVSSNVADPRFGTFFGSYSRKFSADFDFLF